MTETSGQNIGVFSETNRVDVLHDRIAEAAEHGFGSFWMPQIFGSEALTALAVAGQSVPEIRLGTAVVPIQARHPMMMAQQARTVNQVLGGRLNLGIGVSHKMVTEGMWGIPWGRSYTHMREYMEALVPLLAGEPSATDGEIVTSRGGIDVPSETPKVMIAALGPKMLKLAGEVADGTVLWMTGAKTIASHIAPVINAATEEAGRPPAEIVAALPVCVTNDPDAARARAAELFAIYGMLPSYRAMMDREGVSGPEGLVIVGTAGEVQEQICAVLDAGATMFVASEFGEGEDALLTRAALRELLH